MSISIIQDMIREAPDQVTQIGDSITNLTSEISNLQKKQDALQSVCSTVTSNLTSQLEELYPEAEGYVLTTGANFGQSLSEIGNLTDWEITNTLDPEFIYSYTPGDIPSIDTLASDFSYVQDYITKPLGLSGTYGIQDMISKLSSSKSMLEINRSKISAFTSIASKYI